MTTHARLPGSLRRTTVALFVLWGASFGLSYVRLGSASLPVAVTIAAAKAGFVALGFMGVARARASVVMTVLVACVLAAILIGLTTADVVTR
jgi:caa(3)-type oxidase subunit IV